MFLRGSGDALGLLEMTQGQALAILELHCSYAFLWIDRRRGCSYVVCIGSTHTHTREQTDMTNTNGKVTSLDLIWGALHQYRDACIPEGTPEYDDEWAEICIDMAWITEALGLEE